MILFSSHVLAQQAPLLPVVRSEISGINIFGKATDQKTRYKPWHSDLALIAINFHCCEKCFPCFSCHEKTVNHEHSVEPKAEFNTKAIICGICTTEQSISDYQNSNNTCPNCKSAFNPSCSKHHHWCLEIN